MPIDNNSNINPLTGLPFNKEATFPGTQAFTSDVTPGVTFDPKQTALAAERGIPTTPGIDFKQQLAATQSGWQAIKAGTFNALAGAVGELVSVPGYLLNIGSEMSELEDGLGGAFIKAGDFIKENAQEYAPIFTTAEQDEQVFAPFDGKWWGRTIEQLGPTLALLGASYATGGLASSGLAAASTRLGQVSRFAKLAQSLSKTPQAVGILNRAGTIASATLMSRATEGMMEGREIYNQTYDLALENGSSYDEAKDLANEAAAFTYKWNWGAMLTDAIQYTGIYGGFAGLGRLGKALAFGTEVGLESVEEGYQGIVGKEAIREAYKNMGLDVEDNSLYDRIGEYLQDKEIQKAMVQGAMGGTIVQGAGRFLNSAQNKILNKYYNQQRTQDNLKENNEKIKSFLDNNQFVEATSTAYNQVVNKWVNDIVNLPDGYDTAMQVVNMNLEKEDGELNTLYPEGFKIDGKKVEPKDYFETQKRYIESAKAIVDVTQQQHKNEPLTYQEELSKRQLEQNIIADRVNSLRQSYSVAATAEKGKYELSPLGERRYELKDELAAVNKLLAEDIGESKDFLQNKKDYLENQLNELESNMKENDSETFNKDTEELSKYYENTATEYLYKKNKLENSSKNISDYINNLLKEETKVQYRQQANQQLLIDLQEELSVTDTEKGFNDLLKKYARNEEATAIIKADYANKFSKEVKNISDEGFSPAEVEEESKKTSEVSNEQIQFFADKLQDLIQNNNLTGSKILSDLGVTSAQELAKLYYDKNRPEDRKRIQAYFAQFKQDSDTTELGEEIVDTEGVKPSDETTPMPDYTGSPNQVIFAEAVMYKVKRDTNGNPIEATFTINKGVTPKSIKPTDKTDFEINWDSNGWQVLKDENGVFVPNNNWDYLNVDTKNISNLNISDKVELEVNLEDDFVKKQVKDGNIKNLAITVTDTNGNALGNLSVLSNEQLELVRNRVWSELQEYVKTNGLKGKFNPSFNLTVSNINGGRFNSINQLNELYTVLGNEDVTLGVGIIDNGRFSIKLPNLNSTKPKHKDILENFNNNPIDVTPESTVKAGHVYAIIKNPYDKKYYPYRLFTKKLNDTNLKGKIIDIISKVGVDPRMDSDRAMMELQDIVRFVKVNKNGKTNYAPDIADNFHSESNVLFAPKGKMHAKLEKFKNENPEATPEQLNRARAEIFYEMTDMGNKIVQINNSKLNPLLNTPAYNKRIIEEGRMSTDLAKHNGEFFHSPMVAIDLSPVDKAKPKTETTTEQPIQQAGIERRRQEELIKEVKGYDYEIKYRPDVAVTYDKVLQGWIDIADMTIKDRKEGLYSDPEANKGYVDSREENIESKRKYLEINAKYDAEYVDAVKKGELTREQARQSLEEAGRKESEAYAKLAALGPAQQVSEAGSIKRNPVVLENKIVDFDIEAQALFDSPSIDKYNEVVANYEFAINYDFDLSDETTDDFRKSIESKLRDIKNAFTIIQPTQQTDKVEAVQGPNSIPDSQFNSQALESTTTVPEVTPTEKEAKKVNKPLGKKPKTRFGRDNFPKAKLATKGLKMWDKNQELAWFRKNFPNYPIHVLEAIKNVRATGGKMAWGLFTDAAVYIAENAGQGTTYHEAFHLVFTLGLTSEQQAKILNEAREKYPKETKGKTGLEVEEFLADKFSEFVLNEGKVGYSLKNLPNIIKGWFKRMYQWVKSIATDNINIDELFFRASSGIYKNLTPITKDSPSFLKYSLPEGIGTNQELKARLNLVNDLYFRNHLLAARKESANQFKSISELIREMIDTKNVEDNVYFTIYHELYERFYDDNGNLFKEYQPIENKINAVLTNLFYEDSNGSIKPGPLYKEALKDLTSKYNTGLNFSEDLLDESLVYESNDNKADKESWQKAVFSSSPFESLNDKMLLWFSSIPKQKITGKDADGNITIENINDPDFGEGFPLYENPKDVKSFLINKLAGVNNTIKMEERLRELEGTRPWITKIINDIQGDQDLKTLLFQFTQRQTPNFKFIKQDGNSIQIIDSNRNTVERTIRRDIEAGLKSKADIITIVDGKNVFNENRLERYSRAIETIKVDGKNVRERIANLFEAIGFPAEKEVLDYFFTDSAEIKGNKTITNTAVNKRTRLLNSFKSLFTDMSKGRDPFVGQNDSIISIVRQIKDASPSYYQAVHRGLDGQKIYNHIRPTFFGKLRQQIIDGSFLFEEYQKDAFLENNLFIGKDGYYTDPAMRENFQFDIIEGIQENFSKTEYSKLSDLQFEKTAFTLFLGNGNAAIQRKFANYLLPILETAPVMVSTGFKVYDRTELLNEFVKLAQAEAARQSNYALALEKGIDLGVYRTEESLLFLDNEGNPLFDLADVNRSEIRDVIEGWMDLQVQNEIQRFEEIGLTKELEKTQFKATPTAVELYTLNNLLVRAHLAAITTGDIAFYKNTEDFFKRAKEIWSPGEYLDTNREEVHPNTQFIFIKDVEKLTPTWVEAFKEAATKKGMSEEVVNKMAEAYTKSVNITDAQAFITPQRWLEQEYGLGRVTNKTLATFERLMKEEETPSDMRTILQTRKPFIFTHNVLPLTNSKNLVTPLQIKNSEMVLLPSMVKGRPELEAIYNKLIELEQTGEGMKATAVFGSGVKVGSYGVMTLNENNQLEGGITHILDNSAWRLQVETPQHHIDAKNLLGSQLWKLVTGNLEDPMLQSMAQEFDTLLNADIEFKYEQLMKDLSPEEGVSKPLNLILEEAYKRGVGKQFEGITQDIDRNDPKGLFKLFMNPYTTYKAQSLINSLFRNRITKRKINGGSFYNTSSLGYNDLEVVFNEDGSLAHFEVYLPSWLKDVTIEALGEKAREGVVYRIPTEGKYSMFNIKVKGFLPAEAGGNIIMPHGVTTIAGLDFDIDKVYAIFYNVRKNKKGKYEPIPYLDMTNSEPIDRYLEKFNELKKLGYDKINTDNKFIDLKNEIDTIFNIVKEEKWYQDIVKETAQDLEYRLDLEVEKEDFNLMFNFTDLFRMLDFIKSDLSGDKFLGRALLNSAKKEMADSNARKIQKDLISRYKSIGAYKKLKQSGYSAINELKVKIDELIFNELLSDGTLLEIEEFETLPIELQNTQKARDNRKLDIITTILSESTSEVFTPGNFDTIKEVAGKIRELEGKSKENLLPFSNSTYSEIFRRMMDGSALIGPAAINNKSHALFQRSNLTMTLEDAPLLIKPTMNVNGVEFKKSKKDGKYTYEIDGEVVETETFLVRLKSEAIKLGKMRGFNGDLLSLTFNEQLAAVVDNGKDPLANIFNLNLYTTDVFNALLHMGYDLETSMLFTAQPVIKELVKRISNKETTDAETLSEIKTEYKQSIVENIKSEKYLEKVNEVLTSTFYNTLDVQQLEDSIKAHTKAKAEGKSYPDYFYLTQLKVLRNFELMKQKEAKDISNVIRNINTGDNGPGATLADNLLLVDLQDRVIEDSNIENANEFLNDDSKPINNLRRKGVVEAANYLTQTVGLPFNNSMFKKLRQKMNNSKPNSVIVAKDIDKLNFNVLTALATELYQTNGVEMLTTFPQEFLDLKAAEAKKEEGSNFSELFNFFKVDMEGNNPRFMLSNSTGLDESQLDFVREQFELLAEERPELFQKFVDYNFHAYGFEFTPFSYSHTLPTQLVSEGLVETLDRGLSEFTVDKMTEFYEQFLRNHFVSLKYLPYVKEDKFKKLEGGAVILEDLSGVRIAKNPVKYIKSNVDNTPQLFVLDSFTDIEAVYLPVPRLGSHNLGIEYNLNVPGYVSKLNFNTKKTVKGPKTEGFTPILKQGNQMEGGFTPITNNIPSQEFSEAAGTLGSPLESGFTPIKESALTTEKMKLIGSDFMQTYENAEVEYGNIMKLAKNDKISLEQFNEYIEKLKKC